MLVSAALLCARSQRTNIHSEFNHAEQRLERYAGVVGRENVISGTDCGLVRVANAEVMWAKFRAAADGARIASQRLWG